MKVRKRTVKTYKIKNREMRFNPMYDKFNSKSRVKRTSKRLKKKLHLGEYTSYLCAINYRVIDLIKFQEESNTDAFVDGMIDALEDNRLCGTYCFDGEIFTIMTECDGNENLDELTKRVKDFKTSFINNSLKHLCDEYLDGFYGNFD